MELDKQSASKIWIPDDYRFGLQSFTGSAGAIRKIRLLRHVALSWNIGEPILPTLEDIKLGARMRGLDPAGIAEVVQVTRFGPDALNIVFRVDGGVGERLVYRGEETSFEVIDAGRTYAFDADGGLLRLASEAYRIRLAHLFDPYLAVSASQIEASFVVDYAPEYDPASLRGLQT